MSWLQKIAQIGTLYHGTNKKFDSFDLSFAGQRDWGDAGVGVYLSPSSRLAQSYAYDAVQQNGGEPVIYVVHNSLKNIANEDDIRRCVDSLNIPFDKDTTVVDGRVSRPQVDSEAITRCMVDNGFDAARLRGPRGEVCVYNISLLKIVKVVPAEDITLLI